MLRCVPRAAFVCLYLFSWFYSLTVQARCPVHTSAVSELIAFLGSLLVVNERRGSSLALHPHIGPLNTSSGLEPVPRCEPSTYQPFGVLQRR